MATFLSLLLPFDVSVLFPRERIRKKKAMSEEDLAQDLLWGAHAIAEYIGADDRRTYYLLSKGHIPGKKIGAIWTSTKSKLRAAVLGEVEA